MTKPISPDEVAEFQAATFPPEVFEVFNQLIAENYSGKSATVKQRDAAAMLSAKLGCTTQYIYAKGWLNIEDVYRKTGWNVVYDKPGYNESCAAYWVFKKR